MAGGAVWGFPPVSLQIVFSAGLILILGVPHGALDMLYARKWIGEYQWWRVALFVLAYLGVGLGIFLLWVVSPIAFLVLFLAGSAFHFGGDGEEGSPVTGKLVHGLGVLTLPVVFFAGDLKNLFAYLLEGPPPLWLFWWLGSGAVVTLLSAGFAMWFYWFNGQKSGAAEILAIVLLCLSCPPLIAFSIYFCFLHSFRHVIRTALLHKQTSSQLLRQVGFPMLAVGALAAVVWLFRNTTPVSPRIVQVCFVGLAALAGPHMVLVEPVRLNGWLLDKEKQGRSTQES